MAAWPKGMTLEEVRGMHEVDEQDEETNEEDMTPDPTLDRLETLLEWIRTTPEGQAREAMIVTAGALLRERRRGRVVTTRLAGTAEQMVVHLANRVQGLEHQTTRLVEQLQAFMEAHMAREGGAVSVGDPEEAHQGPQQQNPPESSQPRCPKLTLKRRATQQPDDASTEAKELWKPVQSPCPVCGRIREMMGFRCASCRQFWIRLQRKHKEKASIPICTDPAHKRSGPADPECAGCRRHQYEAAFLKARPGVALGLPPVTIQGQLLAAEDGGFRGGEGCDPPASGKGGSEPRREITVMGGSEGRLRAGGRKRERRGEGRGEKREGHQERVEPVSSQSASDRPTLDA
uniref:Uncharacterized protein n=1 Tax=Lygus hesperus TaxID=30085 RepID=A0A0K8S7A6_LYGHE